MPTEMPTEMPTALSRTPQAESRHSHNSQHPKRFSPPNECDSRTFQRFAPPNQPKTSPMTPPPKQANQFLLCKWRGRGGSSRRVREVWRVVTDFATQNLVNSGSAALNPSFKGVPPPPRSFLPPVHRDDAEVGGVEMAQTGGNGTANLLV